VSATFIDANASDVSCRSALQSSRRWKQDFAGTEDRIFVQSSASCDQSSAIVAHLSWRVLCCSRRLTRRRAQEALQATTNAVSEHVREIKSLEGTVADLRATVERQAREQGSREALLTAAEGQIKELQGECQQERVRFSDILQKVNAAFKAKHFGGPQAAEDTPETAAAAAPAAVAPGGLSADEAAELKQRVVDSEKKAEAAAVSHSFPLNSRALL
jgi:hypothetical protein